MVRPLRTKAWLPQHLQHCCRYCGAKKIVISSRTVKADHANTLARVANAVTTALARNRPRHAHLFSIWYLRSANWSSNRSVTGRTTKPTSHARRIQQLSGTPPRTTKPIGVRAATSPQGHQQRRPDEDFRRHPEGDHHGKRLQRRSRRRRAVRIRAGRWRCLEHGQHAELAE